MVAVLMVQTVKVTVPFRIEEEEAIARERVCLRGLMAPNWNPYRTFPARNAASG